MKSQAKTNDSKKKTARKPTVLQRAGVAEAPDIDLSDPSAGDSTATPTPAPSTASTPAPVTTAPPTTTQTSTPPSSSTTATSGTDPTAASPVPAVPPAIMNAPPTVTVPVPPSGFVPVRGVDLRGFRPMQSELATIPDTILELGSIPNWGIIFGITAPSSTSIAQRLQVAAQWTALRAESDSWSSYVDSQEGMAWKDALEMINGLKPAFALATAANPSMLSGYPALARLLGAQKVVAKRAASARKKNAAATSAAPAAAPSATTAAPVVAADAAAAPGRVVTVTG